MASRAKAKPELPAPIIVRKIIAAGHGGHHGGAWKVAYADFVTAMMAFFLLMWIIGATTEKQRKSIADYFSPTLIETKKDSAGGTGLLQGDSVQATEKAPFESHAIAMRAPVLAMDLPKEVRDEQSKAFQDDKERLETMMQKDKRLSKLMKNVRFTETREGLRIDMVDDANFSMFVTGTTQMTPDAIELLRAVSNIIMNRQNPLIIRGHTDSTPWSSGAGQSNWSLSSARADIARQRMVANGLPNSRIARIEGVADNEPYVPNDKYDPRNRRISVTLGWVKK